MNRPSALRPSGFRPSKLRPSNATQISSGAGAAATGDILSCTINADGRSATAVVKGVEVGGTYLWDSANASLVEIASAKVVFTVSSKSFNSAGNPTTIQRTVFGTKTQRRPGTTDLDEASSDGNCAIVFGLSEPIYAKDKAGAGNSGTNPTVAFAAGWYTQGGNASKASALSVTNNSALDYYLPFGQWDILPAEVVEADFRVGFIARHLHGIAAVKFTATGATSAHAETSTTASETKRQRPVTQLYGTCHEATLPIAGFTQAEQIDLRCYVYPLVGDVPMDTADYAAHYEVTGHTPQWVVCNKSGTLWVYGTVSASGNDGTGVASTALATADAAPFLTIKGAIDAGATRVYLQETANDFSSRATLKTTNYWITIEPHPDNADPTTVTAKGTLPATACTRLKFKNVTRAVETNLSFMAGASGRFIANENVTFSAATAVLEHDYNFSGLYFKDCTFPDASKWVLSYGGGDTMRYWYDGCDLATAGLLAAFWRVVGCRVTGANLTQNANAGTIPFNLLIEFNRMASMTGGSTTIELGRNATAVGTSLMGNLVEGIDISPGALLSIAEGYAFDYDHVLLAHNTFVGQRENIFYNDSGSTAYYRRGIRMHGNIFTLMASKSDLFAPADAGRVGNWWVIYGTCNRDNFSISPASFPFEWAGLNYSENADPLFADDESGDGGSGAGDYTLQVGSPALGYLSAGSALVPYDLFGTPINNAGSGAAGAIQT